MLTESTPTPPTPRSRRSGYPRGQPGGILFGMATPAIPALTLRWPNWLAPINGGWEATAHRPSGRRSD